MKTIDINLYEYYNTYSKEHAQCSGCGVHLRSSEMASEMYIEDEHLCKDCYVIHLENLADEKADEETMHDLTYWGVGA